MLTYVYASRSVIPINNISEETDLGKTREREQVFYSLSSLSHFFLNDMMTIIRGKDIRSASLSRTFLSHAFLPSFDFSRESKTCHLATKVASDYTLFHS